MEELRKYIKNIDKLSLTTYYQLINKYSKETVEKILDEEITALLSLCNVSNDKINIWNKFGYYLATKEHSIYESYELEQIKNKKFNEKYLTKQERVIYGIHLLIKDYLVIATKTNNDQLILDIKKILSSIKNEKIKDYIINKLTKFCNTTTINSKNITKIKKDLNDYQNNYSDKYKFNNQEIIEEQFLIDQIDMYIRYQTAKEMYFQKNIELVKYISNNCYEQDEIFEDILQDAMIGLIRAIDKYDIRTGVQFSTFAFKVIKNFIVTENHKYNYGTSLSIGLHCLKRRKSNAERELTNHLKRKPTPKEVADKLGMTEEKVIEINKYSYQTKCESLNKIFLDDEKGDYILMDLIADSKELLENEVTNHALIEYILKLIDEKLTPKEKDLLFKRCGYNTPNDKSMTLEEISKEEKISREAIRKREEKILKKIRTPRLMECNPYIK